MAASSSTPNSASVVSCAPTSGGISRAKRHQLAITGDVISCTKTPEDVEAILRVDIVEKERIKKGIQEVLVQLDADDTIDIEEIHRIRTRKRIVESETSSMAVKRTKGPLDLVYKKSKDTSINDACDKEARARTIQYVGRFFYTCGVAFNVANARAFKLMLEAVGSYGPHLKPPVIMNSGFQSFEMSWNIQKVCLKTKRCKGINMDVQLCRMVGRIKKVEH
ncbi:unnamed protein product [Vicia faba]|uniref:Uncharacterized protein n=1 Tax=Vicia faba TaxID=3906 RepID=A0AAV0YGP5_VICFA|nr:unnamed protein product [Vicia faba]